MIVLTAGRLRKVPDTLVSLAYPHVLSPGKSWHQSTITIDLTIGCCVGPISIMVVVPAAFALGTLVSLAYPRAPFWQVMSIYGHLPDSDIIVCDQLQPIQKRDNSCFYWVSFGWAFLTLSSLLCGMALDVVGVLTLMLWGGIVIYMATRAFYHPQ